jgi:hypothetical protein
MNTNRRSFLRITLPAACAGITRSSHGQAHDGDDFMEEQASRPDAPPEGLLIRRGSPQEKALAIATLPQAAEPPRRTFGLLPPGMKPPGGRKKDAQALALRMLQISDGFAQQQVSRWSKPEVVRLYLRLFNFDLKYATEDRWVPYCAAGVCYAACQAYCETEPATPIQGTDPVGSYRGVLPSILEHYFLPHVSVKKIVADAKKRGTWADVQEVPVPKPGWLVAFDFLAPQTPCHIGIVSGGDSLRLETVEYNTDININGNASNGGAVARRTREEHVLGYVRLY